MVGRFLIGLIRYSCQHSHFLALQPASQHDLHRPKNAPLPLAQSARNYKIQDTSSKQYSKLNIQFSNIWLLDFWICDLFVSCFLAIGTSRAKREPMSSVGILSPVKSSAQNLLTRPVSCYALFKCMAASKPTSWLYWRFHYLFHLA